VLFCCITWRVLNDLNVRKKVYFNSVSLFTNLFICLLFLFSSCLFFFVRMFRSVRARVALRLAVYRQSVLLVDKPVETHDKYFFQLNICCSSPYVTSSLMRGWVCRLQLLLAVASAVILGSDSRRTHDQILLSQIWGSPNLEGEVPVFISSSDRVTQLYTQAPVPFSSPPTTRRATEEVFDPASTRKIHLWVI
jgi:hypothetical protein